MPSVLLSGPAGAGKTALALQLIADYPGLMVLADFQSIYALLAGVVRGPDGRYPARDPRLLPMTEYVRQAIITGAVNRDIAVAATNSDGNPARRASLLSRLGPGAMERVVDPGRQVVSQRLADPITGRLSNECEGAIGRWYDRL